MTGAAAAEYPKQVSREAFDIFAQEDPLGALLVMESGKVEIVERDGSVAHESNSEK